MRRRYPYLQDPYIYNSNEELEKRNFLSRIDNFVNQKQYVRITLLNWEEEPIKEIAGIISSGSMNKDGSSAIRTTCNLTCEVSYKEYDPQDLEADFAINKKVYIELGIKNDTDEYPEYPILWFPQGVFFISTFSMSSSSTSSVSLSIGLKDKMCALNGEVGGTFPITTKLDSVETQLKDGTELKEQKVLIYNIIREMVNHFGGEDLNNIVIEDVPQRIRQLVAWNRESPLYLIKGTTSNYNDPTAEDGFMYQFTLKKPKDDEIAYLTFNKGDTVGYTLTDFVYPKELTMNAGQSVVNALDQIKNTLGNYEYFYDEYGIFHFREIKNYLNTTQGKLILDEVSENQYLVEFDNSKSVYSFTDADNIVSISVNPDYSNIKNDFVIFGSQESTSKETSVQIMYHLAIDDKPEHVPGKNYYSTYGENGLLRTDDEILILYLNPETKLQVAAFVKTVERLPDIGNTNLVYKDLNADEGQQFVYWDSEGLKYKILSGSDEINKEVFRVQRIEKKLARNGDIISDKIIASTQTTEADTSPTTPTLGIIEVYAQGPGRETPWELFVKGESQGKYATKAAAKKAAKKYVRKQIFKGKKKNFSGRWVGSGGKWTYYYEGYVPKKIRYKVISTGKQYNTYNKAKSAATNYLTNNVIKKQKGSWENVFWETFKKTNAELFSVELFSVSKKVKWKVDLPSGKKVVVPSLKKGMTILKNRVRLDVFGGAKNYTDEFWDYDPLLNRFRYFVTGTSFGTNIKVTASFYITMNKPGIANVKITKAEIKKNSISEFASGHKVSIENMNYGQPKIWTAPDFLEGQTFSSFTEIKAAIKKKLNKKYQAGNYKGQWHKNKKENPPYTELKKFTTPVTADEREDIIYQGLMNEEDLGYTQKLKTWLIGVASCSSSPDYLLIKTTSRKNFKSYLFLNRNTGTTVEYTRKVIDNIGKTTYREFRYEAYLYKKLGTTVWSTNIPGEEDTTFVDIETTKIYVQEWLVDNLFSDKKYSGKWVKKRKGYWIFSYTGAIHLDKGNVKKFEVANVYDDYDTRKEAIKKANEFIAALSTLETPAPIITYKNNISEITKDTPKVVAEVERSRAWNSQFIIELTGPTKVHIPSMQKVVYADYKWVAEATVTRTLPNGKTQKKERYLYEFYDTDYEAAYAINNFIHSFGCTKTFKLKKPFDVVESFPEYKQHVWATVTRFDKRTVPRTDANTVIVFSGDNPYECEDWRTKLYLDGKRASILGLEKGYYYEELDAFWPQVYDLNNQIFYGENNDEYEESYVEYEFSGIIYWNRDKKDSIFNTSKTGIFKTFTAARNCAKEFAEHYGLLDTENVQPDGTKKVTWEWTRKETNDAHPQAFKFTIKPKKTSMKDEIDAHTEFRTATEGCYYLDFINASTAEVGRYGINTIGRRTVVYNKNNDVNCLFMPDVPDVDIINIEETLVSDFVSTDSTASTYTTIEDKRKESLSYGHNYTQVNGDIFNNLVNQTNIYSAYDEIKNQLYMHTYYQTTLAITAIPVFYLQPNSRVHVAENSTNTNGDYVIKSINYTLGPGANMNVSLNQVAEKM